MLRMCDGCKDVLVTDQDGSSVTASLALLTKHTPVLPYGCVSG